MKKIFLTYAFLLLSFAIMANPISVGSAQKIASNYFMHYVAAKSDYSISNVFVKQENNVNTFYAFNFAQGGFILISADDAALPVLCYSENGTYDESIMPPQVKYWYNNYSTQIKYIIDENLDNTETVTEWNKFSNNQFPSAKALAVSPLCSTLWDQSTPYNNSCPTGCYTGCVATAMAQIMKKWGYPTTGVGSHTYTDAVNGVLTYNFATTYDWANMINNYSGSSTATQKAAVAKLMYACGVSVNMQYATTGSGAYSADVPIALINNFSYQNTAEIQYESAFTSANWISLLKAELDAGRPVLYSGVDGTEGHAFVFDGYNASNQFDVNWGWSGSSNTYYTIGALNPSGYAFNTDNSAVVRITPPLGGPIADFTASNTTPAVGGTVNFTDESTNATSWTWTFEGGSPATYTGQTPPAISYANAGKYQVILKVANATIYTDSKVKSMYIRVGGTPSAWIKQNTGFTTPDRGISQINIVNPNVVWAAAYNGASSTNPIQEYTKTVNGGNTWTPGKITFTGSEAYAIANFYAFSDQICYACMYPSLIANGGYIVKTTDGGTTWNIQTTADFSTSWADFVYFFDANNGVCVGDPPTSPYRFMIYTTSNGGTNWTQVNMSSIGLSTGETATVNQYDAKGDTIWFGTTTGRVFRSINKGLAWTATASGAGTAAQVTPVFKNASVGIVIATNTATPYAYIGLRKTINGGTSWTAFTAPTGFFVQRPDLDYIPGTSGVWVDVSSGSNLGSSYSMNDCGSFLNIDTGSVQYTSLKMYDLNTGWAGGFNESATKGGIYKWANPVTVGIDKNNSNPSSILIYPNPTNGIVNIQFSMFASEKAYVSVYNMVGDRVMEKEFDPSFDMVLQLNLSGNKAGMYLITVQTGSEMTTKRVMLAN